MVNLVISDPLVDALELFGFCDCNPIVFFLYECFKIHCYFGEVSQ